MGNFKDFNKYLKGTKINNDFYNKYQNRIISSISSDIHPINIFDKLLEDRVIILSGEVDDYSCELIKANLLYLESISDDNINLYINSGGGSVYSGLGLLDVMEFIKPKISTVNTGLAASMAAVILCSGEKGMRKSLKRSRTMIHQPMGFGGYYQQASDMEIEVREINNLKKELYDIISEKTGQPYEKVQLDGDRDYWMGSKDAKNYGIIDEILIKR